MTQVHSERLAKGAQWSIEVMAVIYVAVTVLFLVNADWPILVVNKTFARYDWPMVFFPTEKFWFSLAASVPGTRAFLAFAAAQRPAEARLYVKVLQISLLLAAVLFAWQFLFHKHAPLYAIGFFVELVQMVFYLFLSKKLPQPAHRVLPPIAH
ncbi:MAG: hypothetical protein HWN68_05865 [Desulfobacterales bacterium]|nr:hypothetical protein [Desulfobacterales bacterium]